MHRHAFRSVCTRTRPELEQASDAMQVCIRQFSTTQLLAADVDGSDNRPSRPSFTQRSRPDLANSNPNRSGAPTQGGPPKVLDVKSLPAGLGRGGFRGRGRGGFRGGLTGRGPGTFPPRTDGGGRGGARGGFRGGSFRGGGDSRGGGGMRGRGRGRGGRGGRGRGGKKGGRREETEEDKEKRRKRADEFSVMDPDELEFDNSMRFGMRTTYHPSVAAESFADYMPVTPTSGASKSAAVLHNLSVLGTADPIGASNVTLARHSAFEVQNAGIRFFADVEAKRAAEQHLQEKRQASQVKPDAEAEAESSSEAKPEAKTAETPAPIIQDAEESIRQVITQRAINGQHETPKFATDPVGVARSWHLRAETYRTQDVNSFEAKVSSLLSRKGIKIGKGEKQA